MASHMEANPSLTSSSSTPAPIIEESVRNLHAQLQETQEQNRQHHQAMTDMKLKRAIPISTEASTSSSTEPLTSSYEKKPKARLSKPESFTEENLILYSQFELKLQVKLDIDGEFISFERKNSCSHSSLSENCFGIIVRRILHNLGFNLADEKGFPEFDVTG